MPATGFEPVTGCMSSSYSSAELSRLGAIRLYASSQVAILAYIQLAIGQRAEGVRFELTRAVLGTHDSFQDYLLPVAYLPYYFRSLRCSRDLYYRHSCLVLHTGLEPVIFTLRG